MADLCLKKSIIPEFPPKENDNKAERDRQGHPGNGSRKFQKIFPTSLKSFRWYPIVQ